MNSHVSFGDIKAAAQRVGVSPAEFNKIAWALTLRKYTRQDDVVFGQVMANRDIPVKDAERILGPLINTVPYRVKFDANMSLQTVFDTVAADRGAILSHSHAGLLDIKRWSAVEGELFDTLFVYQQLPDIPQIESGYGLHVQSFGVSPLTDEYSIELILSPTPTGIHMNSLYKAGTISRYQARWMLAEFDHSLTQLCTFQQGVDEVSKLFQLSPAQDVFIESVSLGNCSPLPYELLHHAFEERANSHPGVPAIQHEGVVLSYKELNDRANTLAAMLTSNGVLVGSRVAVITDRCLEFPIGLLATLKAGAAMMPLDVAFPVGRLAFMLADAQVVAIIATKKHEQHIQEVIRAMAITTISVLFICNEELQSSPKKFATQQIPTRSDEAYIVYTSGSTGTPKGVPVLHAGAVNLTAFPYQPLAYQVGMRVMQNMAIGFDWCQEEVWKTLSNGATLVLRGENVFDTLTLVDVVSCTPTALAHFGHPSQYPNLKYVEVGGESISTSLKDLWSPYVCLTNTYGPSECSSTTHSVQLTQTTQVNVGRPTVNVNSYILDARHCRVPIGVLGELYLGGICVSSGYINLPQETETKFLDDPFTGGRMYRTGDIARLLANGNVEIVGRNDSQVKLKGYRIELD
ncbi:hypothetical protein As57867_006168, partial [Aphanomyces stellatus]